jgi:hypothetical protein
MRKRIQSKKPKTINWRKAKQNKINDEAFRLCRLMADSGDVDVIYGYLSQKNKRKIVTDWHDNDQDGSSIACKCYNRDED